MSLNDPELYPGDLYPDGDPDDPDTDYGPTEPDEPEVEE